MLLNQAASHSRQRTVHKKTLVIMADAVEKLEKSESQYFWQIPFSPKMAITCYLCVPLSLIEKHNRITESLPTSFCLKLL